MNGKSTKLTTPLTKKVYIIKPLKQANTLNKTTLLIKPKFGTQVTKDSLKVELDKFTNANETTLHTHNPTISDKNILLQFDSTEDADATKALFDTCKPNFLQGNCNSTIM